jgi:TRAP-type uncharacterized transport system fused permease subunit
MSIIAVTAGIMGYLLRPCNWVERIILVIAAIAIIVPELYSTLAGLAVFAAILVIQFVQVRKIKVSEHVTA